MESIGDRIKNLRSKLNLNQSDFSNAIGISQGNLSEIENNKVSPSIETSISISRYSKVTLDWLLKGDNDIIDNSISNEAHSNIKLIPLEVTEDEYVILKMYKDVGDIDKQKIKDMIKEILYKSYNRDNRNVLLKKTTLSISGHGEETADSFPIQNFLP